MWRRIRYLLVLLALCAIATCPSAHRSCRAKARAREAEVIERALLDELRRKAAAQEPLPTAAAEPTPPLSACCEQGGRCEVAPQTWAQEPWRSLRFSLDRPHRYSVAYAPAPQGAVLRITGDVDCDGVLSSTVLRVKVVGKELAVEREVQHPLE